jgi:hypothetical protein
MFRTVARNIRPGLTRAKAGSIRLSAAQLLLLARQPQPAPNARPRASDSGARQGAVSASAAGEEHEIPRP